MSEEQRLYCVRIEGDVYVVAANERAAERRALSAMRDEPREVWEVYADPVKSPLRASVAKSLPYLDEPAGERRGWTCGQWQQDAAQRQCQAGKVKP